MTRSAGLRLFSQGGLYTAGLFLMRAGNFLLLPLYTALLATDEYGAVGVVHELVHLLVVLALCAQGHSLLRLGVDAEDDEDRLTKLVSSLGAYVGVAGLAFTVLAAALWPLYRPLMGGLGLWPVGLAGLVGVTGQAFFQYALAYLQFRRQARVHTALSLQRWGVMVALVLLLVAGLRWGAAGLLLATGVSFTAGALLALRRMQHLKPTFAGDSLRAGLVYGLPILPHALAGVIFQATDRALLAAGPGLAEVGLYTLAANLASAVFMVAMGMQRAWLPFFLREDRDREQKGFERVRKLSFFSLAIVGGAAVFMGLFAPEIVAIVGREAYSGATAVVPVLVVASFVRAYHLQAVAVVMANKATARWVALATVPAAGLNVWLNLLWIPEHGMMGAAYATLVSHGLCTVSTAVLGRKARAVPFKYVRGALLLALVSAVLWYGHDQTLLVRIGYAAAFGAALLVIDGRDIFSAARSVWRQRGGGQ